jgi:hypothetical protein
MRGTNEGEVAKLLKQRSGSREYAGSSRFDWKISARDRRPNSAAGRDPEF